MRRNTNLIRVLTLYRELTDRHYAPPLEELAAQFSCTTRTIRRDFAALEAAGYRMPLFRYNERTGEVVQRA